MINFIIVIILSILFAATMKVADNLNEHGLKLFKGSNIIFGILWGSFGSLLILHDYTLTNLWLAVLFGWILRAKVDRINHGIASAIILVTFIFNLNKFVFKEDLFLIFFIGMVIIGLAHDYLHLQKIVNQRFSEYFHSTVYYTALPIIYSVVTGQWIIFASMFSFVISYELVRSWSKAI
jgi:hypothetical protein